MATSSGKGDVEINGAATLPVARPGEITLADSAPLADKLARCEASAVIVPADFQPTDRPYITVSDVHGAFQAGGPFFHPPRQTHCAGVSPAAYVSPTAKISDDVEVHPPRFRRRRRRNRSRLHHSQRRPHPTNSCKIGPGCVLFPNAVLYENTVLGGTILHANVVLGAYGFGYSTVDGRHKLSTQLGHVRSGRSSRNQPQERPSTAALIALP